MSNDVPQKSRKPNRALVALYAEQPKELIAVPIIDAECARTYSVLIRRLKEVLSFLKIRACEFGYKSTCSDLTLQILDNDGEDHRDRELR